MGFAEELLKENEKFAELAMRADWTARIPTCPDWTFQQLFRHVARGQHWSAQIVAEQRTGALDPRSVRNGKSPEDRREALDWLRNGAYDLLTAVENVGSDTEVWTFLGPRPAKWWVRRRLHEIAVHRADGALAMGENVEIPPDVATDGLTEWLERVVVQAGDGRETPLDEGSTLHLHADEGAEWTLRESGGGLTLTHEHTEKVTTVAGPATVLLLAVVRRLPADDVRLTVTGDPLTWRGWLDRTPF